MNKQKQAKGASALILYGYVLGIILITVSIASQSISDNNDSNAELMFMAGFAIIILVATNSFFKMFISLFRTTNVKA